MRQMVLGILSMFVFLQINAQNIDPSLLDIKQQMGGIKEARASAELILDVDFINMPIKYADIHYQKGEPIRYSSENFIIIPKKGLDFSWSELFNHEFMTVNRGIENGGGIVLKVLNVIPLDNKSDFAIMTLKIDSVAKHIREAEITSKNQGSYRLLLDYEGLSPFPVKIIVEFELEKIKIPLSFLGKDTEIDKELLNSDGQKKGSITLNLDWTEIHLEE